MTRDDMDLVLYDLKVNYLKKEELYRNNGDFKYLEQNRLDYLKVKRLLEQVKYTLL